MTEEETLQKLNILGIYDPHQLEGEDLNIWWQKKYKEIKDSQLKEEIIKDKLMEINEIYEELSKVDEELLVGIINKQSKQENIVISDVDLYNIGVQHFNKEEFEVSIKKFSEAIDLKSNEPDYFNLRGWANFYLKNYDKALEDASKAIDLKSDEPDNYYLRAEANFYLKNYVKAKEDATKAIYLKSDEPSYYYIRGHTKIKLDEKTYRIDLYIAENLEEIKNCLNKADKYFEENRIIEAIDYYEKVLSKSIPEIKEILGNDSMIRINNRLLEYRRMINS